jgi:hypothetical protein
MQGMEKNETVPAAGDFARAPTARSKACPIDLCGGLTEPHSCTCHCDSYVPKVVGASTAEFPTPVAQIPTPTSTEVRRCPQNPDIRA